MGKYQGVDLADALSQGHALQGPASEKGAEFNAGHAVGDSHRLQGELILKGIPANGHHGLAADGVGDGHVGVRADVLGDGRLPVLHGVAEGSPAVFAVAAAGGKGEDAQDGDEQNGQQNEKLLFHGSFLL